MKSIAILFIFMHLLFIKCDNDVTVHIIPHSHEDPGWLMTYDQYYNSVFYNIIQYVKNIIDSVVKTLKDHPNRKFTYVEQSFFKRWWDEASEEDKDTVRGLVKDERVYLLY